MLMIVSFDDCFPQDIHIHTHTAHRSAYFLHTNNIYVLHFRLRAQNNKNRCAQKLQIKMHTRIHWHRHTFRWICCSLLYSSLNLITILCVCVHGYVYVEMFIRDGHMFA